MARLTRTDWAIYTVSTPAIVTVGGWLILLALSAVTGRHPIWTDAPGNLAEAAAFRDGADVVRRVARGEDLNRAGAVRAGVVSEESATLMPIEAAAASREREMVQLLFDLGASPDAMTWQRAWCVSNEPDVRALLDTRRPAGAANNCADRE